MTTMMRGGTLLRQRLMTYLSATMPPLIDVARTQWGLTAFQLPYPVRYDAADPWIAEAYPIVGMYMVSDRDHVHRDFDAAAEREYWSLYTCRLFVAVSTPKMANGEYENVHPLEETIRLRDDMRSILVNALLASPSLGGRDVEVLEETISTDYDDPHAPNERNRNVFLSGAVINAEVRMTESLYLTDLGPVSTANVVMESVGIGEEI